MSTDEYMCKIQELEYESLRQELLQREKFVFERFLAIILAYSAIYIKFYDNITLLSIISSLFILALWLNHWNVQRSVVNNARIAAYIMLVLEPKKEEEWIGWENALKIYRENKEKAEERIKNYKGKIKSTSLFIREFKMLDLVSTLVILVLFLYQKPELVKNWHDMIMTITAAILFILTDMTITAPIPFILADMTMTITAAISFILADMTMTSAIPLILAISFLAYILFIDRKRSINDSINYQYDLWKEVFEMEKQSRMKKLKY